MKAKLGMKVQAPKKTPFDKISGIMESGAKEQGKLDRRLSPYNQRIQQRIPKVVPKRGDGRSKA